MPTKRPYEKGQEPSALAQEFHDAALNGQLSSCQGLYKLDPSVMHSFEGEGLRLAVAGCRLDVVKYILESSTAEDRAAYNWRLIHNTADVLKIMGGRSNEPAEPEVVAEILKLLPEKPKGYSPMVARLFQELEPDSLDMPSTPLPKFQKAALVKGTGVKETDIAHPMPVLRGVEDGSFDLPSPLPESPQRTASPIDFNGSGIKGTDIRYPFTTIKSEPVLESLPMVSCPA